MLANEFLRQNRKHYIENIDQAIAPLATSVKVKVLYKPIISTRIPVIIRAGIPELFIIATYINL